MLQGVLTQARKYELGNRIWFKDLRHIFVLTSLFLPIKIKHKCFITTDLKFLWSNPQNATSGWFPGSIKESIYQSIKQVYTTQLFIIIIIITLILFYVAFSDVLDSVRTFLPSQQVPRSFCLCRAAVWFPVGNYIEFNHLTTEFPHLLFLA